MSILIGKNSFDSLQADVCYILPLSCMHSGATKEIARRFLHTGLLIMLIVINFFPSKSASSQVLNLTASKTSIFFPLVMSEDTGQIRKGESECKNRDNVFLHCSLAWICVDFSCKTAFISYHVMSAKTRVWSAAVCCLTELSFEKVRRYQIVSHDWLMVTLKRRHDLITVLKGIKGLLERWVGLNRGFTI